MTTPSFSEPGSQSRPKTNGHPAGPKGELTRLLNAAGYASWNQLVSEGDFNWPAISRLNAGLVPPNHAWIRLLAEKMHVDPATVAATQTAAPLDPRRAELSERLLHRPRGPKGDAASSGSDSSLTTTERNGAMARTARKAAPNGSKGKTQNALRELGFKSGREFAAAHQLSPELVTRFIAGTLPKNHPVLPVLGRVLGWPTAVILATQHGKPLAERQAKRIASRYKWDGTAPKAAVAKKNGKPLAVGPKVTARRLLEDSEHKTSGALRKATGVSWADVSKFKKGAYPPNHPALERFAAGLGVSLDRVAATQHGKPLSPDRIETLSRRISSGSASPASRLRHKSGMRQIVRTMITSVNLANMKGERTMEIPTADLATFMRDYCAARGIDTNIVVTENFDKLFK